VQTHRRLDVEEIANSITHGVGLALSVLGLVVLVVLASLRGGALHIVACSVYGATLVAMYGASTLYHSSRRHRARRALRVVDHCAIYLLIAGTYTPFTLVMLRGGWGWTLFGIVWGLAVFGVVFKIFFTGKFAIASTLVYLLMGWMAVVAIRPMVEDLPVAAIAWLVAGGLAYSVGTIFFAMHKVRFHHAIWHVFVLLGSVFHYVAVIFFVVP
jgi:hemolysin III